ncbi:hypothetical protein VTN00DRAFT_251 [Thermoascus crustaceus]|uniref:uncharacterized protein n=1 Tax=Thermoascus crustaceus TaxID=5088 RepID=UPI003743CD6E
MTLGPPLPYLFSSTSSLLCVADPSPFFPLSLTLAIPDQHRTASLLSIDAFADATIIHSKRRPAPRQDTFSAPSLFRSDTLKSFIIVAGAPVARAN